MAAPKPGKWVQQPDGTWTWDPKATQFFPDEVAKWGMGPLRDPSHPPTTELKPQPHPEVHPTPTAPGQSGYNKDFPTSGGYWFRTRNGGGAWTWMNTNEPVNVMGLASSTGFTYEELTNPDHPPGKGGPTYDKDGKPTGGNPQYTGEYLQGDYDGDGKPDKNPYWVAPDVNAPKVGVADGWPKDLTGDVPPPPPNNGSSEAKPPPSHPAYSVDGSAILAAEQSILTPAGDAATTYNELVSYVASTKGWIFSAPSPEDLQVQSGHTTVNYDPNLATTKQLSSASDNLLLNVADAIHAAGAYVEAINAAGQMYSKADQNSFVPET